MEFNLQAGAKIDLLTDKELKAQLENHVRQFNELLSEGISYGKVAASALSSTGLPTTPVYTGGYVALSNFGPMPGYIWSVKNITLSNAPATDLLINGTNPGDLVYAGLTGTSTTVVGSNAFIIQSGNDLVVGFKAAATNAALTLYYQEVPLKDIGKL